MNEEVLRVILKKMVEMRMSNMAGKLEEMAENPNFGLKDAIEVLDELVSYEYSCRYSRRITKLISKAHLKFPAASLDEQLTEPERKIDMSFIRALETCKWIDDGKNLLVHGKAGTGKTYISCALAVCAIQKSKKVLYTKASSMINDLSECQYTGNYAGTLKKYTDPDLLLIDDFGMMSLDINKCLHMFEVLDSREGTRSIVAMSQLEPKKWYEMFQNNIYADACMSRLVNNAYRLELHGRDRRKDKPS